MFLLKFGKIYKSPVSSGPEDPIYHYYCLEYIFEQHHQNFDFDVLNLGGEDVVLPPPPPPCWFSLNNSETVKCVNLVFQISGFLINPL